MLIRFFGVLLLAALGLGAMSPFDRPAWAGPTDDRVSKAHSKGSVYGAIGMVLRLDGDGAEEGTGFLVSPCHVLTAAHVVAGEAGISRDTVVLFYVGNGELGPEAMDGNHFSALSPARPLVWGAYKDFEKGSTADRLAAYRNNGWSDWALLKLDHCLGKEGEGDKEGFGYLKLLPIASDEFVRSGASLPAVSVGLPADRSNAELTIDPDCALLGQVEASGWQHDCTTLPGNSGGPVLAAKPEPGEKWPRVLAITVASIKPDELEDGSMLAGIIDPTAPDYLDVLATSVPVAAFLPKIATYLPEDDVIKTYLARRLKETGKAGNPDADAISDHGYEVQDAQRMIADLSLALTKKPGEPQLLVRRGQWRQVAGDLDSALADFDAALRRETGYAPALLARALLRAARDDSARRDNAAARADFDYLIGRFPNIVDLRNERASLLSAEYEYRLALADYDAVLDLRPDDITALLSRGQALMELGDFPKAGKDFDAAVRVKPDMAYVHVQRAHYLARTGDRKAAAESLERALELEPDMPDAIAARAILALDEGRIDPALTDIDRAVTLDGEIGPLWAVRGSIRQIAGDFPGAIADYRKAGEIDPTEPFDFLLLASALRQAGRNDEAKSVLGDLLAHWPADEWPSPLARHLLGQISETELKQRAGKGNEVLIRYQDFDFHFYLGLQALLDGNKTKAKDLLTHVVDTGLTQFIEFDLARAFLEDLGGPVFRHGTTGE